jgi:hypothetical protein
VTLFGLPPAGQTSSLTVPAWLSNIMIRTQAIVLGSNAANATYAASNALDVWME